ncbi:glycosyltransferase family 2 protein [Nocardioides litoris]|uniref:glycosyltransferase family 2 protein n=1 Tax=Nocardioides litoris TaxID=1926648 RepID=UPI001476EF36|nr:glycosyltransferase [Nocardioides litoris]
MSGNLNPRDLSLTTGLTSEAPAFDIVLATNRDGAHLSLALEGIRSQTYQSWRLWIVDDGVADPGSLARTASLLPRTTILTTSTRSGVSAARNLGIAAGDAEYVAFHDDDDVWMPTKLERQLEALAGEPDAVACHTAGHFVDGNGRVFGLPWAAASSSSNALLSGLAPLPRFVTLAVRRAVLPVSGLFDPTYSLAEDLEFMMRLARVGPFVAVDEELVAYRRHQSNVSTSGSLDGRRAIARMLDERLEAAADQHEAELIKAHARRTAATWSDETAGALLRSIRSREVATVVDEARFALGRAPVGTARALAGRARRGARRRWRREAPSAVHGHPTRAAHEAVVLIVTPRLTPELRREVGRLRSTLPSLHIVISLTTPAPAPAPAPARLQWGADVTVVAPKPWPHTRRGRLVRALVAAMRAAHVRDDAWVAVAVGHPLPDWPWADLSARRPRAEDARFEAPDLANAAHGGTTGSPSQLAGNVFHLDGRAIRAFLTAPASVRVRARLDRRVGTELVRAVLEADPAISLGVLVPPDRETAARRDGEATTGGTGSGHTNEVEARSAATSDRAQAPEPVPGRNLRAPR